MSRLPESSYNDNYDERLLKYITDYVRTVGVPPTIDLMIENVEGRSSKSTVHLKLKKMVKSGLLVQKNAKGYYYPTSIDLREVSVPKVLLNRVCSELYKSCDCEDLIKALKMYINNES